MIWCIFLFLGSSRYKVIIFFCVLYNINMCFIEKILIILIYFDRVKCENGFMFYFFVLVL